MATTCNLTEPRKTCEMVYPSLLTSTPNSVPRSVTMAVGVRTIKPRAVSVVAFPVSLPAAKYPPAADSTSYVTGPCKMTFAPVS